MIATYPNSGISWAAHLGATLRGETNSDGTACFWSESLSGRTALIWPEGFSAIGDPLSLLDAQGRLIAMVGGDVSLAGGRMPDGFKGPIVGCTGQFLGYWLVGTAQERDGSWSTL